MSILSIFNKFTAKELQDEATQIRPVTGSVNYVEAWELEKLEENPRDFFTFHKELRSESIPLPDKKKDET